MACLATVAGEPAVGGFYNEPGCTIPVAAKPLIRQQARPVAGYFTLSGEWWSGDPLAGGAFLQKADAVHVALTLEVGGAVAVPLPGTLPLLVPGLLLLFAGQRRRQKAPQVGLGRR